MNIQRPHSERAEVPTRFFQGMLYKSGADPPAEIIREDKQPAGPTDPKSWTNGEAIQAANLHRAVSKPILV